MNALEVLSSRPLDPSSSIPLYQQLEERMLELIATRAFGEDDPLPNEEDIARVTGLSRGTVRRCFKDLVDDGRVVRRRGRGTFVNYHQDDHNMETAFNFTAEISALGKRPSSRVLSLRRRAASGGVSKSLRVPEGTKVWEITRVRLANEKPMQIVTAYVPCELCPDLTEDALVSSLYTLIAEASGCVPAKAIEVYEAINLSAREADALCVPKGTPAIRTIRTTYDAYDRPFEASVIVLRGDCNQFMLRLDARGTHFSKITK